MLHVFYIVSPITELVSLAFIAKTALTNTDVLFLYPNRYKPLRYILNQYILTQPK
jgi:hypothetical protein